MKPISLILLSVMLAIILFSLMVLLTKSLPTWLTSLPHGAIEPTIIERSVP